MAKKKSKKRIVEAAWLDPGVTASERASATTAHLDRLVSEQKTLDQHRTMYFALYANVLPATLTDTDNQSLLRRLVDTYQLTPTSDLNVVASCVNTLMAMVSKEQPRVRYDVTRGDSLLERRAEFMQAYIDGCFYEMDIYEKAKKSFRDACVFGTGALKFYKDETRKRVRCEWVPSIELYTDSQDAAYGTPQELLQVKRIPMSKLMKMYPDRADEIREGLASESDTAADVTVKVVERWMLRCGDESGRHVICFDEVMLEEEDYDSERFPFSFCWFDPPPGGFFGMGLVHYLAGLQLKINKTLNRVDDAVRSMAVAKWAVDITSMVNVNDLSDEMSNIVRMKGQSNPPQMLKPSSVLPAEVLQLLNLYIDQCFQQSGISTLNTSGQGDQLGANASGAARREYQDTQTQRFALVSKGYHDMFIDAATIILELTRQMSGSSKGMLCKLVSKGMGVTMVPFEEIDMDDDRFVLQQKTSAMLPLTPAAKRSELEEMVKAGWITVEEAREHMGFPDVEAILTLKTASRKAAKAQIDRIIASKSMDGEQPDVHMDLDVAAEYASQRYCIELQKDPEDRDEEILDLLDAYEKMCKAMMPTPAPQQPPAAAANGAQPPGMTVAQQKQGALQSQALWQ